MSRDTANPDFFVAGGELPPDSPMYVKRSADDKLFKRLLAGQFSYVLTAKHMGKSSLMARTDQRLQTKGVSTAIINLSGVDSDISVEQLSMWLLKRLKFQLNLSIDPDIWRAERTSLDTKQLLIDFLHDVVLAKVEGPIVIFVDQINNTIINLDFINKLLAAIQFVHDARATNPNYNRLTFVLFGVATLAELTKNHNQSPANFGQVIDLSEFSREEVQVFQQGLQTTYPKQGEAIFARIYHWTNGHPYLTQKLCKTVTQMQDKRWTDEKIDGLVERLSLAAEARIEPNLQFVKDSIKTSPRRRKLLTLYRQVLEGKEVPENEQSLDQSQLKLLGLVRAENDTLKVRNEIYRRVFNLDWIQTNMPVSWTKYILAALIILAVLLAGAGFFVYQQRRNVVEAQVLVNNFTSTTNPDERLVSLAELFSLPGHEGQARQLFYEELDPAEQIALLNPDDPRAVGEQLITVVKGLHTDPKLKNTPPNNELLQAMIEPLRPLEYSPSLGSIELELELKQWLRGREYYLQGEYKQAIEAYNIAIRVNDRSPGAYLDRGLAYAGNGQPSLALTDFDTVLNLDESWQAPMQQALVSDSQLYAALWSEQGEYQALVALVPTPTTTPTPSPTPTATPLPSPTPTATSTPLPTPTTTPLPPTPTATPTPRPILPTATPTNTPTPSISTGTFTLLNPLSLDDPSFGPTNFEWEWTGPVLPSEFGFEVRVWREGEPSTGAHNAVLDNENGNIKNTGKNKYRLSINISDAYGVKGQPGDYFWTVALVKISPEYADLEKQAEPARLRLVVPSASSGGGDDDGGGGGGGGGSGVGID